MAVEHGIFATVAPKVIAGVLLGGMVAWGALSIWKADFRKDRQELEKKFGRNSKNRQK